MYEVTLYGKKLNLLASVFLILSGLIILFPLLFPYVELGFTLIDEILILVFTLLIFYHVYQGVIPWPVVVIIVSLIFLFGISIISPYYRGFPISILQIFTHLKFFIVFYLIVTLTEDKYKISFFHIVAVFSLVGILVNLFFPGYFEFTEGEKYRFLEGIPRVVGFQSKPNNLAYSAILLQIVYGFYLLTSNRSDKYILYGILTISSISIVVLSGSRASLIFYPVIFYYSLKDYFKLNLKNLLLLSVIFSLMMVVFILLSDTFIDVTSKNLSTVGAQGTVDYYNPRSFLYYYGYVLFIDFFPVGTGAATFGSTYSPGSDVYKMLGIDQMQFVQTTAGLFDSNLACIAGEFGLLGLLLFIGLSIYFYKWGIRHYESKYDKRRFVLIYIFLIFLATKGNVFMNGIYALLFSFALTLPKTRGHYASESNPYRVNRLQNN
ncbi:MAG: hypothetical protein RIC53_16530 [Cyclobacteriaceae bacterium]